LTLILANKKRKVVRTPVNVNHRGKSRCFIVKCFDENPIQQMHTHSEQLTRKNLSAQRWSVVLLAFNFIGAVIYVVAASHGWVIPQEREAGLHSVTGEPYVWAGYVFPICAVFLMLNLTWGAFVLGRKRWQSGIFWLLTIPIWLAAVVIDFAHH
jgi:hypothetical protein